MITMDYLPIQATSVPCEQVFSSVKETDTMKRNQISPVLMEALQLLKFLLKKECLNFTRGWSTPEAAMGILIPHLNLRSLSISRDNPDAALDVMLQELSTFNGDP
jgi:hypothetical protein